MLVSYVIKTLTLYGRIYERIVPFWYTSVAYQACLVLPWISWGAGRALASRQCDLGLNPGPGVISGLSLLSVLSLFRGFFSSSLHKRQHQ